MPADGNEAVPFHMLPRRKRLVRAALSAFTLYHVFAMLVNGAAPEFKNHLVYAFGAYDEALKMTNSWGMFGKPPTATHVIIEGESEGSWRLLSSTRASDRSWRDRVRDLRLRKIQGKLADPADRARLGNHLLAYACRSNPGIRTVRLVHEQHEERDDAGEVTKKASKSTVLRKSCR